jgi:anaerobic ribonucleoside-triphosphate reductase
MAQVYVKNCPRCGGDVSLRYQELVCLQCGNRNFEKATRLLDLLVAIKKEHPAKKVERNAS